MMKYVRMSRFAHFKRLRYGPTDQPTDQPTNGHDLLQKCEDALKKKGILDDDDDNDIKINKFDDDDEVRVTSDLQKSE